MAENSGKRWWAVLVPIGWAGAIFVGSSLPGSSVQKLLWVSWDKVYHIIEFGVLVVLVIWAMGRVRQTKWSPIILVMGFVITAVYAPLDEYHQSFIPGRDASIMDMTADWVGCFVGTLGIWVFYKLGIRPRRTS
jgi:VanZ family protein